MLRVLNFLNLKKFFQKKTTLHFLAYNIQFITEKKQHKCK